MSNRSNKENVMKDILNVDILNKKLNELKSPVFGIQNYNSHGLKEKVTRLVQLQLKTNQINQNFLNYDKTFDLLTSFHHQPKDRITIYINTKYDIVATVSGQIGFKIVNENECWNIMWIDGSICSLPGFSLNRDQRVNHFPGMNEISRKDKLQRNLKIMQRYFVIDYDIFPKTWSLPTEKGDVINFLREKRSVSPETFIIKPACSSQGRGIILINDIDSLEVNGNTICQIYIKNPFLIDGFKFDLRLYVLITSCDPLRIYVYEEGLARFATHVYERPNPQNLSDIYMHLTNYSVQRNSDKFDSDEIYGTKRRATTIYNWLKRNGHNADAIWKSIDDVLIKTMLCANNSIKHHYSATFPDKYRTSACFELLGFDIILDENLKPFVLEVNHSPSLETETNLDIIIKTQLLKDIFSLINALPVKVRKIADLERMRIAERFYWSRNKYMSSRKAATEFRNTLSDIQAELEKNETNNKNGFRILYPIIGQTEKYQRFFEFNCDNHRITGNKFVTLDEPEHKVFFDLPKESLPQIPKKHINVNRTRRNRTKNQAGIYASQELRHLNRNIFHNLRESKIVKQLGGNIKLENTLKDIITHGKASKMSVGDLLNTSKKSLIKIISSNKPSNPPILLSDKLCDSNCKDECKNSSILKYDNNEMSQSPPICSDIITNKFSENNDKRDENAEVTDKNKVLYKVSESRLYEEASMKTIWECSLLSNISHGKRHVIDMEPTVSATSRSDSKDYGINSPELSMCSYSNSVKEKTVFLYSANVNVYSIENVNSLHEKPARILDSYVSRNIDDKVQISNINEEVSIQNEDAYPQELPSINIEPELIMYILLTEKETENIYSTGLSVSSIEVLRSKFEINGNNEVLDSELNSECCPTNNDVIRDINTDLDNKCIQSPLFIGENNEYLPNMGTYDIVESLDIGAIQMQNVAIAEKLNFMPRNNSFDIKKYIYRSETLVNSSNVSLDTTRHDLHTFNSIDKPKMHKKSPKKLRPILLSRSVNKKPSKINYENINLDVDSSNSVSENDRNFSEGILKSVCDYELRSFKRDVSSFTKKTKNIDMQMKYGSKQSKRMSEEPTKLGNNGIETDFRKRRKIVTKKVKDFDKRFSSYDLEMSSVARSFRKENKESECMENNIFYFQKYKTDRRNRKTRIKNLNLMAQEDCSKNDVIEVIISPITCKSEEESVINMGDTISAYIDHNIAGIESYRPPKRSTVNGRSNDNSNNGFHANRGNYYNGQEEVFSENQKEPVKKNWQSCDKRSLKNRVQTLQLSTYANTNTQSQIQNISEKTFYTPTSVKYVQDIHNSINHIKYADYTKRLRGILMTNVDNLFQIHTVE